MPFLALTLLLLPSATLAWNVLFVNVFGSGSHQTVSGPLANLLVSRGHHVTYMSTNIPGYVSEKVEKLKIPDCEALVNGFGDGRNGSAESETFTTKVKKTLHLLDAILGGCERFFNEPNVQNLMKSGRKFDLFLTFSAYFDICALGLGHALSIPNSVLHMSAPYIFPLHLTRLGLPLYASSVKIDDILLKGKDHRELAASLPTRLLNLFQRTLFTLLHKAAVNWYVEPVLYTNIPSYPGYKVTYRSVRLMMLNIHHHPLVDGPTPFGPGVIALGGSLCTEYNKDEIESYEGLAEILDTATQGFIFMSFGSLQMDIPHVEQRKWLAVFQELPYKVLWKQNKVTGLPDNVKLFNWLPQQSLLQHPKFKLFITHGGHSSKTEVACAGKPMLVVPQFAKDQFYNARRAAETGIGDHILDLTGTSVEVIRQKILNLTDGRYDKRLRTIKRQVMMTRLTEDQIVGHLDAVVSGFSFLPGYQPWYEYLYLDVLIIPALLLAGILVVIWNCK